MATERRANPELRHRACGRRSQGAPQHRECQRLYCADWSSPWNGHHLGASRFGTTLPPPLLASCPGGAPNWSLLQRLGGKCFGQGCGCSSSSGCFLLLLNALPRLVVPPSARGELVHQNTTKSPQRGKLFLSRPLMVKPGNCETTWHVTYSLDLIDARNRNAHRCGQRTGRHLAVHDPGTGRTGMTPSMKPNFASTLMNIFFIMFENSWYLVNSFTRAFAEPP